MPSPPRLAKCLDIARLPRNANRLSHINTRGTSPGSAYPVLYKDGSASARNVVDPAHPAARLRVAERAKLRPIWKSPYFDLHALPTAWLVRDADGGYYKPWRYPPYPERRTDAMRSLDVSLVFSRRGDYISSDKFVWSAVKRRLRTALQLVVTRGARTVSDNTAEAASSSLVFDDAQAGADNWVKADWTYVFYPKNELYFLNVNQTVGVMRTALAFIMAQATQRDRSWGIPSRGNAERAPPPAPRGSANRTSIPRRYSRY